MRRGRQTHIARELLSISEVTVEDLARKHGCEVVADTVIPLNAVTFEYVDPNEDMFVFEGRFKYRTGMTFAKQTRGFTQGSSQVRLGLDHYAVGMKSTCYRAYSVAARET